MPGENTVPDPLHPDYTHIRDVYFENNKDYEGRFTVPTLYDKKQKRTVNNESSEIIRMFYHAFDDLLPEKFAKLDLLPKDLDAKIEEANEWTYNDINNGTPLLLCTPRTTITLTVHKVSIKAASQRNSLYTLLQTFNCTNDPQHPRSLRKERDHALQIPRPRRGRARRLTWPLLPW